VYVRGRRGAAGSRKPEERRDDDGDAPGARRIMRGHERLVGAAVEALLTEAGKEC
jgi:hypothetical protein